MTISETASAAFDLFHNRWALVTAGTPEDFNTCTVGWGSLGTLWARPGKSGAVVTVYVHPARYTSEYLEKSGLFTVSFFPAARRYALAYLGSHSGRDGDKVAAAGLTPEPFGGSVTFKEAEYTLLARKIYAGSFQKEGLDPEIREHYQAHPGSFPPDANGDWLPHKVFIGEVLDTLEREVSLR